MIDAQDTLTPKPKKKCTLIFFFASDNALSPSTLPQLKAIKAAGSQDDTNVLVYFDPNEMGAPTRVFEINRNTDEALAAAGEPAVSVLSSDYISPEEIGRYSGEEAQAFAASLNSLDELEADTALHQFLGFCRENYPAKHYMLFLLGHGLVVGRDAFLPDDNPRSAIGLETLGSILRKFSDNIGEGDKLDLVGMHSCSMSAVEVAYQLKGTAKYMLGSQGLSFVGSWPYRQLVSNIFHDVKKEGDLDVDALVRRLHSLCIQYSVDFMHAGYSSDMCLCSLDQDRIDALTGPISELSRALQNGIGEHRCRDLIVLSHWKSQSYWQETYTDLYDFCLCLSRMCREPKNEQSEKKPEFRREYDMIRREIMDACVNVMNALKPENGKPATGPVVCVDYAGPDVQYSHGLSIYFPWSRPREDANDHVIKNYRKYAFTGELTSAQTWWEFLNIYFDRTKRLDRLTEEEKFEEQNPDFRNQEYKDLLKEARATFPVEIAVGSRDFFPTSALEGKVTPPDASGGGGCACASVKNYSKVFTLSPGAADVFGGARPQTAAFGTGVSPTRDPSSGGSSTGGDSSRGGSLTGGGADPTSSG